MRHRGQTIRRALQVVRLLQSHRWLNANIVAAELKISHRQAQVWLCLAEEVLPVVSAEREVLPQGGSCPKYYRLMKVEKNNA